MLPEQISEQVLHVVSASAPYGEKFIPKIGKEFSLLVSNRRVRLSSFPEAEWIWKYQMLIADEFVNVIVGKLIKMGYFSACLTSQHFKTRYQITDGPSDFASQDRLYEF